ncbi:Ig-like domain-containing protein [Myxococcus landrumensis]|uniref:Tandem-95 repeat protein n=1 Tax=Myxococcus landrumensis TaxID=2813577 RepID=A0ABX7NK71_9BACT|nr:Ig-like domain-containing protein [Myxococcus landrumus]QSQ17869.1 tandem-95 repeat protein [Myxococcus landrumus]
MAPSAVDDQATTDEDASAFIQDTSLVSNDFDADGDGLRVLSVGSATHGSVTMLEGGTIRFAPEADFSGTATFEYVVGDGRQTDTGKVTVTVSPMPDVPKAVADSLSMTEDSVLVIPGTTLLANDTDADGDTLRVASVRGPAQGAFEWAHGNVTFTPDANFFGTVTFEYMVSDGTSASIAPVTITVTPVNDAPSAVKDDVSLDEDVVRVIPTAMLLANDTDIEGDTLSVTGVGSATHGTVTLSGGNVTFTPEENYFGDAGFEYTVSDGHSTSAAKVALTVNSVSDAPVAVADTVYAIKNSGQFIRRDTLTENDINLDRGVLIITAVRNATHCSVKIDGGDIDFSPEANFTGTATFEYTARNWTGGTSTTRVTVLVTERPVAVDDAVSTDEDTVLVIPSATLVANDTDGDGDILRVEDVFSATRGSVTLADGNITFTPEANFFGSVTFEYRVSDGRYTSNAKVSVTVNSVNDAPRGVADSAVATVGAELRIPVPTLLLNDSDQEGDSMTVSQVANAHNGVVALDGQLVRFTPAPGFVGTASFEYQVSDIHGAVGTGFVSVRVRDYALKSVSAGRRHTCAVFTDGRVKCWGGNTSGQLGLEHTNSRGDGRDNQMGGFLPFVRLGMGQRVTALSLGESFTCALFESGGVKCWGLNSVGQLGLGDMSNRGDAPDEMGDSLPWIDLGTGRTAKSVVSGSEHVCAILDNGEVKCWGRNDWGQLGLGDKQDRGDGPGEMGDALPRVNLGTGRTAKALAAGAVHTCALLDDDSVKCWGTSSRGQLGLGYFAQLGDGPGEMGDALASMRLGTGRTAKALATREFSTCALLDDGSVKCWGSNDHGQLGLGDSQNRGDGPEEMGDALPSVLLGTGRTALALTVGAIHTCALLDDGSVKCWGCNDWGELGLGYSWHIGVGPGQMGDALPRVNLGTGRAVTSLEAGTSHTCATFDEGSVKCWGGNFAGQLGLGDRESRGDNAGEMGDVLPVVDL